MMNNFLMKHTQQNEDFKNQNIHSNEVIRQFATKVDTMDTYSKLLETQISQVA